MLEYFLFFIIFGYITNWVRLYSNFLSILKSFKKTKIILEDQNLIDKYKKKTGLDLNIYVLDTNKISGAMITSKPFKPRMLVSKGAFKYLDDDERDWLILHEAGHYIYYHVLLDLLLWLYFLSLGLFFIYHFQLTLVSTIFCGIILSIIFYQLERLFEYHADEYALSKVDDREAMAHANQIMKRRTKTFIYKNPILTILLTPHLTYDYRIKMAKSPNKKSIMSILPIKNKSLFANGKFYLAIGLFIIFLLFIISPSLISNGEEIFSPTNLKTIKNFGRTELVPKIIPNTETTGYKYVLKGKLVQNNIQKKSALFSYNYVLLLDSAFKDEGREDNKQKVYTSIRILQPDNKEFDLKDYLNKHIEMHGTSVKSEDGDILIKPDSISII